MGIVIPCGVVNLKTCSVICYADGAFANAEGEKSQCGKVVSLTHNPELVKTGLLAEHHNQESRQIHTGGEGICCV